MDPRLLTSGLGSIPYDAMSDESFVLATSAILLIAVVPDCLLALSSIHLMRLLFAKFFYQCCAVTK